MSSETLVMKSGFAALALCAIVSLPAAASIPGMVFDEEGKPLGNIEVAAFRVEGTREMLARLTSAAPRRVPLAMAKTDLHGSYTLDITPKEEVDLIVNDPSFAPAQTRLGVGDRAQPLKLERLAQRTGFVMSDGQPVAGAIVYLRGARALYEALTDARGAFNVPDPSSWATTVTVVHPDYVPRSVLPAQALKVSLERGAAVSGKVLAPDGSPVAGAQLRVDLVPAGVTAADGTFTIPHLAKEHHEITATTVRLAGRLTGGTAPLTIAAVPAATVTVSVRDGEKHPAQGVVVFLVSETGGSMGENDAVTDAGGTVSFSGVAPGDYGLMINSAVLEKEAEAIKVRDATPITKEIVAKQKPILSGAVNSADGAPVAGATVLVGVKPQEAVPDEMRDLLDAMMQPLAASDGQGRFSVRIGSGYALLVGAFRRGGPQSLTKEVKLPATGVVLTIPKGFPLHGRVTAGAQPLAGVRVQRQPHSAYGMSEAMSMPVWAVTDAKGEFSGSLAAGSVALAFARDGFVPRVATVDVGESTTPMVVSLEAMTAIRGRVRHADGTPAEGVMVWSALQENVQPATTAADGAFTMSVPKGPATLEFGTPGGGRSGRRAVTAPADDVVLTLPATAIVRGHVVDEAGAAIPEFQVTVAAVSAADSGYASPHKFTDPGGAFVIEDAPAGVVRLRASAQGFLPATKELSTAESSAAPVVMTLTRGRVVRGRVTGPDHQPLEGVQVHAEEVEGVSFHADEGEMGSGAAVTGEDGTYTLTGLALGEVGIQFSKSGLLTATRRLAPGDKQLDAELSRGRQVHGSVVDASGAGVGGVSVNASSAAHGAEAVSATTDASGAFQMSGLLAAHYDFSATLGNQKGAQSDVDLSRDGEVRIALRKLSHATLFGKVAGFDAAATSREVVVTAEDGSESRGAIDSEGNYRIEDAPAGEDRVYAMLFGLAGSRRTREVLATIAPDSKSRVDLSFDAGIALRGNVTYDGKAVAGASVDFTGDGRSDSARAQTSEGGAYEIAGLSPGAYEVRVLAADPPIMYQTRFEARNSGVFDIAVTLTPVQVSVLDAVSGLPLADVAVSTAPATGSHTQPRGTTDLRGSLSFQVSPGAADHIVAEKSGYATAAAPVPAGGEAVVVKMAPTEGAVVRLVDARDGQTLSGIVVVRDDSGRVLTAAGKTNDDGSVTMPVLAGTYRFSASATNYGSETVKATVPGNEVRIGLPRGGKLVVRSKREVRGSARLIGADGEEYVRCWCNGIAEIRLDGRLTEIEAISPGVYTLEVTPENERPQRFEVSVIEGRTMTVEIP